MLDSSVVVRMVLCGQHSEAKVTMPFGEITNGGETVPRVLQHTASDTPDRQAVRYCIKSSICGVPYSIFTIVNAAAVPKKYGVNILNFHCFHYLIHNFCWSAFLKLVSMLGAGVLGLTAAYKY
ncbi:hypothetical protein HN51_048473 [Arachis hypogaea]